MDRGLVVRLVAQVCWFGFAFLVARVVVAARGASGAPVVTWPEVACMALALTGGLVATVFATRPDKSNP